MKMNVCRSHCWRSVVLFASLLVGCEQSPFGPVLTAGDQTPADSGDSGDPSTDTGDGGDSSSGTVTSITCSRTTGHSVYYAESTVSLAYTCAEPIESFVVSSKPSWLTMSSSGSTVTATGTAPNAIGTVTWEMTVNGKSAGSFPLTVISPSHSVSFNPASISIGAIDDVHTEANLASLTLDGQWDGLMSQVDLGVLPRTPYAGDGLADHDGRSMFGIDSNMHGMAFESVCPGSGSDYLCPIAATSGAYGEVLGGVGFKWDWGAFDQGTFYVKVRPLLTVEGAEKRLAAATLQMTVPRQSSGGNETLDHGLDLTAINSATFNSVLFPVSAAIMQDGVAKQPKMAVVYPASDGANSFYLTRLSINRGTSVVSKSARLRESGGANSGHFKVRPYDSTHWLSIGSRSNTDPATDNLWFNRVADGSPASNEAMTQLTVFPSTCEVRWPEITKPFADADGVTRVGVAYVLNMKDGSASYVAVGKLNPLTGEVGDGVVNTDYYDLQTTAGTCTVDLKNTASLAISHGNLRMLRTTEGVSQAGYFYAVYRKDTDIELMKVRSARVNNSYDLSTVTVATSVLTNQDNANQAVDMALGSYQGSTAAGVVYGLRGNACKFKRINSALSEVSAELTIESSSCFHPTIHYISETGRFLVVYGHYNGATYDIKYREITPGASADDLSSSTVVVATGGSAFPIKLSSTYDSSTGFVGIIYRINGANDFMVHGFQAPWL
jgi:hypothetical protein